MDSEDRVALAQGETQNEQSNSDTLNIEIKKTSNNAEYRIMHLILTLSCILRIGVRNFMFQVLLSLPNHLKFDKNQVVTLCVIWWNLRPIDGSAS